MPPKKSVEEDIDTGGSNPALSAIEPLVDAGDTTDEEHEDLTIEQVMKKRSSK